MVYEYSPTLLRNWSPATALSLHRLAHDMVMLMALVSAHRIQSLHKSRLDSNTSSTSKITFYIHEWVTEQTGIVRTHIEISAYPIDDCLCIMRHLFLYIENSKQHRSNEMAETGLRLLGWILTYSISYHQGCSYIAARNWMYQWTKSWGQQDGHKRNQW